VTTRNKTPLWNSHQQLGARLIDFGGWDMPVSYRAGTIKEHHAVRQAVGLFDVSHMGEAYIRGPRAREAVDSLTTNAVAAAANGKAVYTLLCRPDAGIVDDCIFYKVSDQEFFVIVNASNTAKDLAWIREHIGGIVDVDDVSDATALIAVQGPKAVAMIDTLSQGGVTGMTSFTHRNIIVAGIACLAARTGYTGEDGFELACTNHDAPALWAALLDAATPLGGLPIGLGARDTLRLEAKLPLYGNDIDDTTTPLEAGLGWAVKLDKGPFFGREVLQKQKADGCSRGLIGFSIDESARAIARHGYSLIDAATRGVIGHVTSGGPGVSVKGSIGMAYVATALAKAGTSLTIDCRGKDVAATVVSGKFYKRPV
jgi:aminomethyltransferase